MQMIVHHGDVDAIVLIVLIIPPQLHDNATSSPWSEYDGGGLSASRLRDTQSLLGK